MSSEHSKWSDRITSSPISGTRPVASATRQISYEQATELVESGARQQMVDAVQEVFNTLILANVPAANNKDYDNQKLETAITTTKTQASLQLIQELADGKLLTHDNKINGIRPVNQEKYDTEWSDKRTEKAIRQARKLNPSLKASRLHKELIASIEKLPPGQIFAIDGAAKVQPKTLNQEYLLIKPFAKNLNRLSEVLPEKRDELIPEQVKEMFAEYLDRGEIAR